MKKTLLVASTIYAGLFGFQAFAGYGHDHDGDKMDKKHEEKAEAPAEKKEAAPVKKAAGKAKKRAKGHEEHVIEHKPFKGLIYDYNDLRTGNDLPNITNLQQPK